MTSEISSAPELIYYCEFDPENWDDRLEITFSNEHVVTSNLLSSNEIYGVIEVDVQDHHDCYSKNIFGENVLNITSIVGKNGIGKSHILRKIYSMPKRLENAFGNEVIADPIQNNTNVFCVYFDGQDYFLEKTKDMIKVKGKDLKDQSMKNSCRMFFYNIEPFPILKLEEDQKKVNERVLMQKTNLANLYELIIDKDNVLSREFKDTFSIPDKKDIVVVFRDQSFENIQKVINKDQQLYEYIDYVHANSVSERGYIFPISINLHLINNMLNYDIKQKEFIQKIQDFFEEKTYKKKSLKKILLEQQEWIIERYSTYEEWRVDSSGYWKSCLRHLTRYFLEFKREPVMSNLTGSFQEMPTDNFDKKLYDFLSGYEYYKKILSQTVEISLGRFSSGQESILFQISSIIHHINHELRLDEDSKGKKTLIFFIDEYEQNLHPEWARIYLRYLLDVFEEIKKKNDRLSFQVIITTHSPYLISDLPKENIRLIQKDEKTGKREVSIPKHSFASNYYDILSDSFFLEDTIGEFAKQKINGWITELNTLEESFNFDSDLEKLTRIDEIKGLIDIVDDQFIRNKLLELAEDVKGRIEERDDKDLQKYLLDQQIAELQKRRKALDLEDNDD